MQKSKEFFFRSVFILKLTTPKQIPTFKVYTVRGSLKIRRKSEKFWRGSGIYFIQNVRIRTRIGTKHETVPEKFKGMIITSSYGTVPY